MSNNVTYNRWDEGQPAYDRWMGENPWEEENIGVKEVQNKVVKPKIFDLNNSYIDINKTLQHFRDVAIYSVFNNKGVIKVSDFFMNQSLDGLNSNIRGGLYYSLPYNLFIGEAYIQFIADEETVINIFDYSLEKSDLSLTLDEIIISENMNDTEVHDLIQNDGFNLYSQDYILRFNGSNGHYFEIIVTDYFTGKFINSELKVKRTNKNQNHKVLFNITDNINKTIKAKQSSSINEKEIRLNIL